MMTTPCGHATWLAWVVLGGCLCACRADAAGEGERNEDAAAQHSGAHADGAGAAGDGDDAVGAVDDAAGAGDDAAVGGSGASSTLAACGISDDDYCPAEPKAGTSCARPSNSTCAYGPFEREPGGSYARAYTCSDGDEGPAWSMRTVLCERDCAGELPSSVALPLMGPDCEERVEACDTWAGDLSPQEHADATLAKLAFACTLPTELVLGVLLQDGCATELRLSSDPGEDAVECIRLALRPVRFACGGDVACARVEHSTLVPN